MQGGKLEPMAYGVGEVDRQNRRFIPDLDGSLLFSFFYVCIYIHTLSVQIASLLIYFSPSLPPATLRLLYVCMYVPI